MNLFSLKETNSFSKTGGWGWGRVGHNKLVLLSVSKTNNVKLSKINELGKFSATEKRTESVLIRLKTAEGSTGRKH